MTEETRTRLAAAAKIGSQVDNAYKIVRTATALVALAAFLWAQYLGPGARNIIQDFIGITELNARMDFIEAVMPVPTIVAWDESGIAQVGVCSPTRCLYRLTGSRTEYGDSCGRPVATVPIIRYNGSRPVRTQYRDFQPVELGRAAETFVVDIVVPPFVASGPAQWRAQVTYPTCLNQHGETTVYTPWFPVTIANTSPNL